MADTEGPCPAMSHVVTEEQCIGGQPWHTCIQCQPGTALANCFLAEVKPSNFSHNMVVPARLDVLNLAIYKMFQ